MPGPGSGPERKLTVDRGGAINRAQKLAERGAQLARKAGFDAEGLAVAEEVHIPTAETIVSVASEREAVAIVVGPTATAASAR